MSDAPKTNNVLAKVLTYAVLADILWALLFATLQAVVLAEAGGVVGASTVGTTVAVVITWIIGFVIGLLQGAVFMIVIGGFIWAFSLILSGKMNKPRQNPPTDGTQDQQ